MEMATLDRVSGSQKVHGDHNAKPLLKIDDSTKHLLAQFHNKCFPPERITERKFHGSDYRQRMYEYLLETSNTGIRAETAIRFHNAEIYEADKSKRKDCSGGQLPGLLIFSNS